MKKMHIAIDGPASSGKSTVAKKVAADLSLTYLDTGAMYRAATFVALQKGTEEAAVIIDFIKRNPIRFQDTERGQLVFIGLNNVTEAIRLPEVSQEVSKISALGPIRDFLVAEQRRIAADTGIVMDGRDIGTVVLPEAELKIYLVADVEERARRRHKENLERGITSDLSQLVEEIKRRDTLDSTRDISPLRPAADAFELDSTGKSIDEVVTIIENKAKERMI